jgi:hypothetical protein
MLYSCSRLKKGIKMEKTVTVNYSSVDFTIIGEYADYVPANFHDPAKGGCFEDYQIFVESNDITELLNTDAISEIINLANAEAGSDDGPDPMDSRKELLENDY